MSAPATSSPPSRAGAVAGLHEEFAHLLAAERRLRGRDQQRAGSDMSNAHVRALFALGRHEESTAGEIARSAQLSPASVTGMLDDLERSGIVARRRSTTDRRNVLVSLTDDGRALLDERRRRWAAIWKRGLAEMPTADLEAAARVMRTIADLLDEL